MISEILNAEHTMLHQAKAKIKGLLGFINTSYYHYDLTFSNEYSAMRPNGPVRWSSHTTA